MEVIYSPKCGLANRLTMTSTSAPFRVNGCSISVGGLVPMHLTSVRKDGNHFWQGVGVSLCQERSKIKAYGEFIERYCAYYTQDEEQPFFVVDSYANLVSQGYSCLDPNKLIPFEDHQYNMSGFPYSKYTSDIPITWNKGLNLSTNESILIPAEKVYLSPQYSDCAALHIPTMSTGLACGSSLSQATLAAVYEIIERDSFMLTWNAKLPGIRIDVDHINCPDLKAVYAHTTKHLLGEDRLAIFDISRTIGVYTILAFIRNDLPSAVGLVVATASSSSPETAVLKVLEELSQVHSYAYNYHIDSNNEEYRDMHTNEIDTLVKHMLYYTNCKHNSNIDFIFSSGEKINLSEMIDHTCSSPEKNLAKIIDILSTLNHDLFFVDITRPEFHAIGFKAVKAILPDYLDINRSHNFRHLNNVRQKNILADLGRSISDAPHPFA